MRRLLVIEDGTEYDEFVRLFLADVVSPQAVRSAKAALDALGTAPADGLLVDLRFERAPRADLVGASPDVARLFGGDEARAERYLKDEQGAFVLAHLRSHGHDTPALFVSDFPPRRLANLRKLYGRVDAIPSFDARALRSWVDSLPPRRT